jgi:hypothetical protein
MAPHLRPTARLKSFALALLSPLLAAGCGDDACDEVEVPATFQTTAMENGKLEIKVENVPLPVENQAVMMFHATGKENGLWISFRDGADKTSCPSTAAGSDACSIRMYLQPGSSFEMGMSSDQPGRYFVEGELYDYVSNESLFRPPVCRSRSQITVIAAD